MPKIEFKGHSFEVSKGRNLRKALKAAGLSPHNGAAQQINCKGLGTCGTCAVEVLSGEVSPLNKRERWRLNFPPHQITEGLRLACQIEVQGDLSLRKHSGFWGEKKGD